MINIAWQIPDTSHWIGGLNYYRNLLEAIYALPNRQIEPVLFGYQPNLPPPLDKCLVLLYPGQENAAAYEKIQHILQLEARSNVTDGGFIARYLKQHNIQLLSHGNALGCDSTVPSLCWIPDFQHCHLPHFFAAQEVQARNREYHHKAQHSQGLLFSSHNACKDFKHFFPEYNTPTYILQFVAPVSDIGLPPIQEVLTKYHIEEDFFHVPNQLWAHKNHSVIANALGILKKQNKCPLVISTGQTSDYRNPQYFSQLQAKIAQKGLTERFRFLDLIPYADMQVLMRHSIAMINPSLFEGWSSTVEEGKSLGKRILLSSIPVHLEQAPERSLFFDPQQPEMLAQCILDTLAQYDKEEEIKAHKVATEQLPQRILAFAENYQNIILKILANK